MEKKEIDIVKSDLKIRHYRTIEEDKPKYIKSINPILPQPSFLLYICGQSGSGKSNLLYGLFHDKGRQRKYYKAFNCIHYFCPTSGVDNEFKLEEDKIHHEINDETVNEAFESLEMEYTDKEGITHQLYNCFIFDDAIAYINGSHLMMQLFFNFRHKHLSIIVISQAYKRLVKSFRDNIPNTILFKCNKEILEEVYKEKIECFRTFDDFFEICKDVFSEKYNFLMIKDGMNLYKNFDKINFKPVQYITIERI